MQYKEWLDEWFELFVKPNVKIRTYNKYKQQARQYICPHLGHYEISNIQPIALQSFIAELQQHGLSANTVNGIITVLKSSLCRAVKFGVCEKQFTDSIIRPKAREKYVECFTKDEQRRIEHYILSNFKAKLFGIIICLYTGLRIGELLALKWQDIDLNKEIISITKTCRDSWSNGKYIKIEDTPKTMSSQRVIPVPKQLITLLKILKKKSKRKIYN